MVVVICILKLNYRSVWLNLTNIKEHLIDLLICVCVWSTKIITLSNSLFHLKTIHGSKSYINTVNWLHLSILSFNYPVHPIEHLHLHAPFTCDSWILIHQVKHHRWSQYCHIWIDCFDLLLTNPLGS